MSSFLCGYKEAQDLLVWESTELLSDPCPVFDEATNRWTVYISREGKGRTLYPRHVVLAIGTNTLPKRIEVPGLAEFQGVVYHSAGHRDAARSTGRRIVIIGAVRALAMRAVILLMVMPLVCSATLAQTLLSTCFTTALRRSTTRRLRPTVN